MSADLYPANIWAPFADPNWVLADEDGAREVVRARTPASSEVAVLYTDAGSVWRWRGHASPWLVAVLDTLCGCLNSGFDSEAKDEALNNLQLPPVKRYCRVMADELWQAAVHA